MGIIVGQGRGGYDGTRRELDDEGGEVFLEVRWAGRERDDQDPDRLRRGQLPLSISSARVVTWPFPDDAGTLRMSLTRAGLPFRVVGVRGRGVEGTRYGWRSVR